MGDKSPKSKERGSKQKAVASTKEAAAARTKQDANSRAPKTTIPLKGKK